MIATLSSEAGEPFFCYYDPKRLPYKIAYYPLASTLFPGREDEPSDLDLKMQLISARGGNALEAYLSTTLALVPDVDYQRHSNGERGGTFYFDILTDSAIEKLFARAHELGAANASDRASRTPSHGSSELKR